MAFSPKKTTIRIVHIDDDEENLKLVRFFLGGEGMEVFSSTNPVDGLELILKKEPHLILLDIEMPSVDGLEACARIRQHPKFKSTPIIMVTGMSQKGYVEKALANGATDYINKPFDL